MKPRPWAEEERQLVREWYGRESLSAIARRIPGRTTGAVAGVAKQMGLRCCSTVRTPEFIAFLRARSAEGWTDSEIAADRRVSREDVRLMRVRLGLPSNRFSPRACKQISEATRRAIAICGQKGGPRGLSGTEIGRQLGLARSAANRRRAAARGWPPDLMPHEVRLMEAIWDGGPQTARQIFAAVAPGPPRRIGGVRRGLKNLASRGLVVRVGSLGVETVYSLPLTIKRRKVG